MKYITTNSSNQFLGLTFTSMNKSLIKDGASKLESTPEEVQANLVAVLGKGVFPKCLFIENTADLDSILNETQITYYIYPNAESLAN